MNNFLIYLAESGISLTLFFAVYWFLLRKETFFSFNRFFLLLSIPISLLIPFLDFSFLGIHLFKFHSVTGNLTGLEQATTEQIRSFDLLDFLLFVYLQGVIFLTIRFFYQMFKLLFLMNKFGVQKQNGLRLVITDDKYSPFSFFNYIFVNHKNFSQNNFDRIIAHERIHIKQVHSFDTIITELLIIFQWFNPFVWPYKKALKETHEYLADEGVIAQGFSTAKYQMLIFEQLVGVKMFEFANNFNDSQIKRRLKMMTKHKSHNWGKLKVLLTLPAIFFLLIAFSTPPVSKALIQKDVLVDQDKMKKVSQEKVVADAKTKELKSKWVSIDKKLEDKSLSKKEKESLLKKQQEIEMALKEHNNGNRVKLVKSDVLLGERKAIEKKLASGDLSKKDKAKLKEKLKQIEITLKKQKMADEKKVMANENSKLLAERKAIEKKLASGKLSDKQKIELKNKMKKIDQVLKKEQKRKKVKSGDVPPPPPKSDVPPPPPPKKK